MAKGFSIDALARDLESPTAVRGFGSGWFSGFFALLLGIAGFGMVAALRWPDLLSTPELAPVYESNTFRFAVHLILLAAYTLALVSLMLRPRKALGFSALFVALAATIMGGAGVQPA